ncbi:MAG: flagellar biosynthetic protein FliO [Xanthomonadaceae bacterium]|nr:flagellar biosynthetic protein FliO [Xanthomonadaceae bacterium]
MRISIGSCLLLLGLTNSSFAGQVLKNVQILGPGKVELQFDEPVQVNQLKTEYVRDIIQVNLNNVVVYPAKILTQAGSEVSKVFAYQYTPKQVRCRLSVRGEAEKYKNHFKFKISGKSVFLTLNSLGNKEDKITLTQSAPQAAKGEMSNVSQSLLSKILKSDTPSAEAAPNIQTKTIDPPKNTMDPIKYAKPLPSPFKSFAWLGVIILVLLGVLTAVKRVKNKGMPSSFLKMTRIKFGAKPQMIEMVANQYLGPKKSISIVRVSGRLLVLGVAEDSISLITELGSEDEIDSMLDQAEIVAAPKAVKAAAPSIQKVASSAPTTSFREEIRKRMEGMKTL